MSELDNLDIKINADLKQVIEGLDTVYKEAQGVTDKINEDFSTISIDTEQVLDLSEVKDVFSDVTTTFNSSLKRAITKGEFDFANFAERVSNIFLDLGLNISQSFLENIFSGASGFSLGGLFSGASNSGGSGLFSGLGSIVSGVFSSIFGGSFANGGDIPADKVSLVGEKGPELFIPNTSGQIISNVDSAQAVESQGNGDYNINFHVNAVDGQSFVNLLQQPQARNVISNFAVNAVHKQANKSLRSSPFE